MLNLNLPYYPFKLREDGEKLYIFDEIRRKYLLLSPEEWVRQHLIQFLIIEKLYPRSLIQIEGGVIYNSLKKRSDVLIIDHNGNNVLLAECKSPEVKLSNQVLDQAARYNQSYKAPLLVISNGMQTIACQIDHHKKSYKVLQDIPIYNAERD